MRRVVSGLRRLARTPNILASIQEGIANETALLNDKLTDIKTAIAATDHGNALREINQSLGAIASATANVSRRSSPQPLQLDYSIDLPYPKIDLNQEDPIAAITRSIEYQVCVQRIGERAVRETSSLLSECAQALLYCLVRAAKPTLVVEIGSYKAGTSKVICSALAANEAGLLHSVDPYWGNVISDIVREWPQPLQRYFQLYPVNSMEYYNALAESRQKANLVLVDGNHDYEWALFDIEAAARVLAPGAFVFVDNVSQSGPFLAAQDFLRRHLGWEECGGASLGNDLELPFSQRSPIENTDFCILRAPATTLISRRPYTEGQLRWRNAIVKGIRMDVFGGAPGVLSVQSIVRAFRVRSNEVDHEVVTQKNFEIHAPGNMVIPLDLTLMTPAEPCHFTVEPWFMWTGDSPLSIGLWALE